MKIKILDLFSGIGGISLGLERTGGFKTVGLCEIEPFCRKILAHHWPGVPIHEDVTALDGRLYKGLADMVVGGFPQRARTYL
jgi:DNA (cytosine-5)-methyltransferase 1